MLDEHHPRNAALIKLLRAQAATGSLMPCDDGYELHTHPDLCERFREVTRGEGGAVHRWGGIIAVDRRGVAFAYALGMRTIWFRLSEAPDNLELRDGSGESPPSEEALPGEATPRREARHLTRRPRWIGVSPWQSEISTAEGLRRLASTAHDARITTEALT